jgi:hypothetical protein
MSDRNHKTFLGLPHFLAVSGFALAISIGLIYFLHSTETTPKSIWHVIGEHFATAFAVLGVWHVIDQLVIKREFRSEIVAAMEHLSTTATKTAETHLHQLERHIDSLEQSLRVAKHDPVLGLSETFHDVENFSYSQMIRESQNIIAVLGDGYSWVGRHAEALADRFADATKKTTIILVHPESELTAVLARKVGMQKEHFRHKIYSTVRQLKKLNTGKDNVKIWGHTLINSHSVFIADNKAVFSPYFLSTQRRMPPIFVLRDTGQSSFFSKLKQDVNYLEKECSPISEQLAMDLGEPGSVS